MPYFLGAEVLIYFVFNTGTGPNHDRGHFEDILWQTWFKVLESMWPNSIELEYNLRISYALSAWLRLDPFWEQPWTTDVPSHRPRSYTNTVYSEITIRLDKNWTGKFPEITRFEIDLSQIQRKLGMEWDFGD